MGTTPDRPITDAGSPHPGPVVTRLQERQTILILPVAIVQESGSQIITFETNQAPGPVTDSSYAIASRRDTASFLSNA
jgi:hypothetical protein